MTAQTLLWRSRARGPGEGGGGPGEGTGEGRDGGLADRVLVERLRHAVAGACSENAAGGDPTHALATLSLHRGVDTADVYAYVELAAPATAGTLPPTLARALDAIGDAGASTLDLLQPAFAVAGAAAGAQPAFHYVVETDPAEGWQDEMFRWYDEEHMPGLAATPGCIRARRYVNRGHGPLSLACYDLLAPAVTASAPWLAVRGTAWSSRIRPQFRNTRRTMFRSLPPGALR